MQTYAPIRLITVCNVHEKKRLKKTVDLMLRIYFTKGVFILIHFDYRAKIRC